jgi:hypothetical protein
LGLPLDPRLYLSQPGFKFGQCFDLESSVAQVGDGGQIKTLEGWVEMIQSYPKALGQEVAQQFQGRFPTLDLTPL